MTQPTPPKLPVDLTKVGPPDASATRTAESESFVKGPFDPLPKRENVRGWIAFLLLLGLLAVILAMMGSASYSTLSCLSTEANCLAQALDLAPIRTIGEVVLTPLVGLVGAVTGFYFGEKSAASAPPGNNG